MTLTPINPNAPTFISHVTSSIRCEGHNDVKPYRGPRNLGPVSLWILENRRSVISGVEEQRVLDGRISENLLAEFTPQVG